MMFPTAVRGHIPFAPTYSERVEKHQQERRRRATNSVSGGEHAPKRKSASASGSAKRSLPVRSASFGSTRDQTRNSMSLDALKDTVEERHSRLFFSSDSQITVNVSTFRKTNDLHAGSSPNERNRKHAFLKCILNLFRRRTRLSIDVRSHSDNGDSDLERHATTLAAANTVQVVVATSECVCDGDSTNMHQTGRQRRSNTLRLESILEEDAESDENDNEIINDAESDSAIDVHEDDVNCLERALS